MIYLFFLFTFIRKELRLFNNIDILGKFLKILPSHKTILKSSAYYRHSTAAAAVASPEEVLINANSRITIEGKPLIAATYETAVRATKPVSIVSAMPARAGKVTYNIIPNFYFFYIFLISLLYVTL